MPGTPLPRRLARAWPVLAVLLSVALALGLGAFASRTDRLVPGRPGEDVDCGNLVFRFTSATVQRVPEWSGADVWEVVAEGSVRNPHAETLSPLTGEYGNFVLHDRASARTAVPNYVTIGESLSRLYVAPGNTPVAVAVSFRLPAEYSPGARIELGLVAMEYTDNVILGLGGGQKVWNVDSAAPVTVLELDLARLPDRER